MILTPTKKTNPHAWFFAYLRNLADSDGGSAEVIQAGIVCEYSKNETESLPDIYKNHNWQYTQMKKMTIREEEERIAFLGTLDNVRNFKLEDLVFCCQ